MTSAPVRDPLAHQLITPWNATLLLINLPSQPAGLRSMDRDLLVKNTLSTVKTIKKLLPPRRDRWRSSTASHGRSTRG